MKTFISAFLLVSLAVAIQGGPANRDGSTPIALPLLREDGSVTVVPAGRQDGSVTVVAAGRKDEDSVTIVHLGRDGSDEDRQEVTISNGVKALEDERDDSDTTPGDVSIHPVVPK